MPYFISDFVLFDCVTSDINPAHLLLRRTLQRSVILLSLSKHQLRDCNLQLTVVVYCQLSTAYFYSNFKSSPNPLNSCTNTLNDSGTPGLGILSPFTIASYVFARPMMSSDFNVSNSCRMLDAPYASSAHTSISPKR